MNRSIKPLWRFLTLAAIVPCWGADLYVSPSGNDAANGSLKAPFATVARALKQLSERKDPAPITLWLEDGRYAISDTVNFGAKDASITVRAVNDGKVILDAAHSVSHADFSLSDDPRLDPATRGRVVMLDLTKIGVKHTKTFPDRFNDGGGVVQLFRDGGWQPMSRWPNEHNTVMKKVLDRGDDPNAPGKRPGTFVFADDRPKRWKAAADAGQLWLAGF